MINRDKENLESGIWKMHFALFCMEFYSKFSSLRSSNQISSPAIIHVLNVTSEIDEKTSSNQRTSKISSFRNTRKNINMRKPCEHSSNCARSARGNSSVECENCEKEIPLRFSQRTLTEENYKTKRTIVTIVSILVDLRLLRRSK